MNRRSVLFVLSAAAVFGQQKSSREKGPEVELIEASAHVEDRRLNIDGQVRNVGDRPIRKLTIFYEILDGDKKVLTRQQGPIDQPELGPGEEARFQAQMAFHARAVSFRLAFEDGGGRELRAEGTGPFAIEQ